MTDQYTIRRYRADDLEPLVSGYREIFDADVTPEWFAWKYEANPYAGNVPVYVAETDDGEFVGAAGFWPLKIDIGKESVRAIQPCDALVLEEHRRQGIYDRILSTGLGYYARRDPRFCIDFPNELTKSAFEKHGWQMVGRQPTYYRILNPKSVLDSPVAAVSGLAGVGIRGYLGIRDRWRRTDDGVDVERYAGIAAELLAPIHRSAPPDAFHAIRDEQFFRWRFGDPRWEYETYVARENDIPRAGAVVGTRTSRGVTTTRIADVVPLGAVGHDRAYAALLEAVVRDRTDSDLLVAPPEVLPHGVLTSLGFHRDDRFPLSMMGELTNFGVYPLSGDPGDEETWVINGRRLTDPATWTITFSEMDTG